MKIKIRRIGNGVGVTFPKKFLLSIGKKAGDYIELDPDKNVIIFNIRSDDDGKNNN